MINVLPALNLTSVPALSALKAAHDKWLHLGEKPPVGLSNSAVKANI